jgi:hypothetical protein
MPSKTKAVKAAMAALPSIPKELIDQFVTGPMSAEAVNAASLAFKKALIERALGAELGHHLGYPPGAVRFDLPIQVQAMPIEAPGKLRLQPKGERRGHLGETHARSRECGVGFPESVVAAEIRQAGIDAHAGAGGDDHSVALADQHRGACDVLPG